MLFSGFFSCLFCTIILRNGVQKDKMSLGNEHGDSGECQGQETPNKTDSGPLSGWLMKRGRLSHRWRRRWFQLRKDVLLYGKASEESSLKKKILLEGALVTETDIDGKQFAFRIKSKDNGRLHYLNAENEEGKQEWMQAIYLARGVQGDNSQACIIQ